MSYWKDLLGGIPRGDNSGGLKGPSGSKDPDTSGWEPRDALFLFDADQISNQVSAAYGAFAQGAVLKAMSAARVPEGGWRAALIYGCDGDLLDQSLMGETPGFQQLSSWLRRGTHEIDTTLVDVEISDMLQLRKPLRRNLYVVGLEPPQRRHVVMAHQKLESDQAIGYLGVFILKAVSLSDLACELGLVAKSVIQDSECTGWLASHDDLQEAGLYVGKLRFPG